jgi:hypothetical protein
MKGMNRTSENSKVCGPGAPLTVFPYFISIIDEDHGRQVSVSSTYVPKTLVFGTSLNHPD